MTKAEKSTLQYTMPTFQIHSSTTAGVYLQNYLQIKLQLEHPQVVNVPTYVQSPITRTPEFV